GRWTMCAWVYLLGGKKIPLLLGGIFTFLTTSRRSVICSEIFCEKSSKSYKAVCMQLAHQDLHKDSFEYKLN
ncbi:MAG TPA: hypothetical protein VJ250_04340, partial [Nitrososphaeraceae archaeon]|nr:hypothetical protein [Nitrososphaeraceae archaeon]